MSTAATPDSAPAPEPKGKRPRDFDPTRDSDGPPEEEFWERYNHRLEFPLSTVAAVLIHVLVAAFLIVLLTRLMARPDRASVPVKLIDVGGMDDAGMGSQGGGGQPEPLAEGQNKNLDDKVKDALPDPQSLPEVNVKDLQKLLDDPDGSTPISKSNAAAYQTLNDDLKKKLLGAKKGSGPGTGTGNDGVGAGPGGAGADSSRARSLRWVMRFRTNNGDDYVAQLAAMGAVVLVPLPPDNSKCLYIKDLKSPGNTKIATDDDLRVLANQIKFSDTRPDSVRGVCQALGVKENAKSFWAFFPRGLEADLSRKETNYRNRRAEDIEETIFRVISRGGGYDIVVDDQTVKN